MSFFKNKSEEIIESLISESQINQFEIRNYEATEGQRFYENTLTHGTCWKKYFPENRFSGPQDLIAIPITKEIISKISSSIRDYINFSSSDDIKVKEIYKKYNIDKIMSRCILNSLIIGNTSLWLSLNNKKEVSISEWKSWFILKKFGWDGKNIEGYIKNYVVDSDTILPANISENKKNNINEYIEYVNNISWTIWQNGKIIFDEVHGMPFIPVVWFNCIDMDEDERYGIPFYQRFRDLLIKLNQLVSTSHRQILALPTTWYTTKDFKDNAQLLQIRPDVINYVGSDKELAQTPRQLDLTWEQTFIDIYLNSIYQVSQLPPKEFLNGASKVESGVALKIVYSQFQQLLEDMTKEYHIIEEELIKKIYFIENEKELKEINIEYINAGIPVEDIVKFNLDKSLFDMGIVTLDELKSKWKL